MSLDKYVDELGKRLDVSASVIDDYEAQVEDLTQRLNVAAADLLETRSQRAHLARQLAVAAEQAIEHAKRHAEVFDELMRERAQLVEERDELAKTLEFEREHHRGVRGYAVARQAERDEARDEVVRLGRELESYSADYAAVGKEVLSQRAENVRLRTIITELGAAEAAEPPLCTCPLNDVTSLVEGGGEGIRTFTQGRDPNCPACAAEPQEEIEALRPGVEGFDEWLLDQPGGAE